MKKFGTLIFLIVWLFSFDYLKANSETESVPIILQVKDREIVVNGRKSQVFTITQTNGVQGLFLKKGDLFNVILENHINQPTGVHWHGILLPNNQDGVPFVTQPPIPPGGKYAYQFPLIQSGTYWMHAHYGLEEQKLLTAPLILYDPSDHSLFSTPNIVAGKPIPIGDLNTIVELYRMQRGDASLEEIVALIEQEVGLGVRLLKYMNSAYFGFAGRVSSITQAATMLGTRGLSRWALIVAALSGSNPIPRELALMALTRARTCELVGLDHDESLDSDELFTIGLLSTCDAVFRMPMQQVVESSAGGARRGRAAASRLAARRDPRFGDRYERGEFLAPSLRSTLLVNSSAYREALDWARRAVYGMP